jgi:hypothetical protein
MDYAGLIGDFKVNRKLTDFEKKKHLIQKDALHLHPHYQLSVIKMNSTYLELVDKWYGDNGFLNFVSIAFLTLFLGLLLPLGIEVTLTGLGYIPTTSEEEHILGYGIFILAILIPTIWMFFWIFKKESFAFTHYPTIFNRKSKMVHVFKTDGSVFSTPWDDIYFTLSQVDSANKFCNILGHVLSKDKSLILDTFSLSVSQTNSEGGLNLLRCHWEFVRRYMEYGPESVSSQVQFCLPISTKKETLRFGINRLLANSSSDEPLGFPILFLSIGFDLLSVPFRYIAMLTSKIPTWPPEIVVDCQIEVNDPYAIEGNPQGDRIAVYPDAANAAGIIF